MPNFADAEEEIQVDDAEAKDSADPGRILTEW
jgi:hypothetical protein